MDRILRSTLAVLITSSFACAAFADKIPNKYEDNTSKAPVNLVNADMANIGKVEIEIDVAKDAGKPNRFFAPIGLKANDPKKAPHRDTYAAALVDVTKQVAAAMKDLKEGNAKESTVTIKMFRTSAATYKK